MFKYHKNKTQRGFSLIEMSVTLTIIGVIAMLAGQLIPKVSDVVEDTPSRSSSIDYANNLIKGFVIVHSRLPCPDNDDDGRENCSLESGKPSLSGTLPYVDMGLSAPVTNAEKVELYYAVNRQPSPLGDVKSDADLAQLNDRYNPLSSLNLPASPKVENGLDFCVALDNSLNLNSTIEVPYHHWNEGDKQHVVNPAYIIVDAGQGDADSVVDVEEQPDSKQFAAFDGLNTKGLQFELPNKQKTLQYDDVVLSVSAAQLAGEIGCQSLLARVTSAARATQAAQDIKEFSDLYAEYKRQMFDARRAAHAAAAQELQGASVDKALVTTETITAIATFDQSEIDVLAMLGMGFSVAAEASSIAALAMAVNDLDSARENETSAKNEYQNALELQSRSTVMAEREVQRLTALNANGWFK